MTVDFRWGEKLTIIENVPAKVCNECGERYYQQRLCGKWNNSPKKDEKKKSCRFQSCLGCRQP
ncbi:MAG: YgiT-type zinc finger protein [Deltaproteobacteria bacterium]|nr:YgiT-type zinc finger protein [Deltaproteobacteria bacterium]